ncbi:hypothetical protein F4556_007171 [Kitasatospora gansuensis]|uniref:Cytochrome P450 n=1 Tax=Kitasatospora gansuensis TaxID=258050 RepID=A0A7W7SJJ6_9ACTN|nr:hypothetical protein [Kitasatospora gansuensis]MBB4951636.1 hypothetical protein [Kitasatospora gansuensis]
MTTEAEKPVRPPRPPALWSYEGAVLGALLTARQLPWLDAPARALGVRSLTLDGLTELLAGHLNRIHAGHPLRLPTPLGTYLVPVTRPDASDLLEAARAAGAIGPGDGLDHAGRPRRQLACAAVPYPARALGRTAAAVAAQEIGRLPAHRDTDDLITPQQWTEAARRIARRLVAGDAAADDTVLSRVLAAAVDAAGTRREADWADALRRRLDPYLRGPARGGLAGYLARRAEHPDPAPALEHTLAVVTDALCHTVPQAIALTSTDGGPDSAEDAVRTALDLWPPIAATTYRTGAAFAWHGDRIPAGSRILCASAVLNALARQDSDQPTSSDGLPSPLCSSPEPCPATRLAVLVAETVVRAALEATRPALLSPALDPHRLPGVLDPGALRLAFHDRADAPPRSRVSPNRAGTSRDLTPQGEPTTHYAQLATAGATRLTRHAESLANCAEDARWTGPVGERFRMALLRHARRCAVTAADLRHAADRLGRLPGGPGGLGGPGRS